MKEEEKSKQVTKMSTVALPKAKLTRQGVSGWIIQAGG